MSDDETPVPRHLALARKRRAATAKRVADLRRRRKDRVFLLKGYVDHERLAPAIARCIDVRTLPATMILDHEPTEKWEDLEVIGGRVTKAIRRRGLTPEQLEAIVGALIDYVRMVRKQFR
jgi:hypothetical protein